MLKKTRVSGAVDTARLAMAVARPGIDPRVWVSLAIVEKIVVDPAQGVFVDLTLVPSGDPETARLGAVYAGAGFGLYAPLAVDDEVVVIAPSGDPDEGLVVVARLWSAADIPPENAASNPDDLILHVQENRTLRIVSSGSGNLVLDPRGTGKVLLGGEDGLEAAALGTTIKGHLDALKTALDTHTHSGTTPGTPIQFSGPPTPGTFPSVPDVEADKVEVK